MNPVLNGLRTIIPIRIKLTVNEYNNQNSGAPGPFQTPPTNLPTNIKGGALGYFATYDYKRFDYTVK